MSVAIQFLGAFCLADHVTVLCLQVRRDVDKRTVAAFEADPGFKTRSLADLNREAASLYKVQ